jgi:putative transposase
VLDDFSRYIIARKLTPTMGATDVTETLDQALAITGVDQVRVKHRPRLLSDYGPRISQVSFGSTWASVA